MPFVVRRVMMLMIGNDDKCDDAFLRDFRIKSMWGRRQLGG
jgi:hypothetical protein